MAVPIKIEVKPHDVEGTNIFVSPIEDDTRGVSYWTPKAFEDVKGVFDTVIESLVPKGTRGPGG